MIKALILSLLTAQKLTLSRKGERKLLVVFSLIRRSVYVVPLYLVVLPLVGGSDLATLSLACFWAVLIRVFIRVFTQCVMWGNVRTFFFSDKQGPNRVRDTN